MKQEDISYYVAQETGHSRELVELVIDNFWLSIRHMITHPLESRKGILLHKFGKFHIPLRNIKTYLKKYDTNKTKSHKKEIYIKLVKQLSNEKGQTREED